MFGLQFSLLFKYTRRNWATCGSQPLREPLRSTEQTASIIKRARSSTKWSGGRKRQLYRLL